MHLWLHSYIDQDSSGLQRSSSAHVSCRVYDVKAQGFVDAPRQIQKAIIRIRNKFSIENTHPQADLSGFFASNSVVE
jgi:hypothetical protein